MTICAIDNAVDRLHASTLMVRKNFQGNFNRTKQFDFSRANHPDAWTSGPKLSKRSALEPRNFWAKSKLGQTNSCWFSYFWLLRHHDIQLDQFGKPSGLPVFSENFSQTIWTDHMVHMNRGPYCSYPRSNKKPIEISKSVEVIKRSIFHPLTTNFVLRSS